MAALKGTVSDDAKRLTPGAVVDLYHLDINPIIAPGEPAQGIIYVYSGTGRDDEPVVFRGNEYIPIPMNVRGFEMNADGKLQRPVLQVSNLGSLFSPLVDAREGLLGAHLHRVRTFERYLDDGADPNPLKFLATDFYLIGRKKAQNRGVLEFELHVPIDVEGVYIPRRVHTSRCPWVYRDADSSGNCPWAGFAMDINNIREGEAGYLGADACNKLLTACKARFQNSLDPDPNQRDLSIVLPFGGWPGVERTLR